MPIQYDGGSKILRRICQILNVSSSVVTLSVNDWAYSSTYGTWAQTVSVSWMSADLDIEVAPVQRGGVGCASFLYRRRDGHTHVYLGREQRPVLRHRHDRQATVITRKRG